MVEKEFNNQKNREEIPAYIDMIAKILPILFIPFPFIKLVEILSLSIPQVNINAEVAYAIASLVSKSFLQWTIFFRFIFTNLYFSERENPDKVFVDVFGPIIGESNSLKLFEEIEKMMDR